MVNINFPTISSCDMSSTWQPREWSSALLIFSSTSVPECG